MEYFDDIVFVDVQLRSVGEFDQKLTYFLAGILNFDHGGKSQRWVNKQCPEEFGRRRKDKLMGLMGDRIFEHAKLVFSHAIKRNVFIKTTHLSLITKAISYLYLISISEYNSDIAEERARFAHSVDFRESFSKVGLAATGKTG